MLEVFLTHAPPPCRLAQHARDHPRVDVNQRDLPQVQTTYNYAFAPISSCSPLSPRLRSPAGRMKVCSILYVKPASVRTTSASDEVPPIGSGPL